MPVLTIDGKSTEVPVGTTAETAAAGLGLNPEAYLFLLGRTPVPADRPLQDGETVRALKVASGG